MVEVRKFKPNHPLLYWVFVLTISLVCLTIVSAGMGRDTWAGFLAMYAVLTAIVLGIGFASLLSLKYSSQLARRRSRSDRSR